MIIVTSKKFYLNLLFSVIVLVMSLLIFFHAYSYSPKRVSAMVIEYLIGAILFYLSIYLAKKAMRRG